MSGEIEAAGALATAGMAAKAIEKGGSGAHGGEHGPNCLNCDTVLDGPFCHTCGQPAHLSRTLGEAFHDFMHSVLHFDTRAWRTLPMLVGRPGTLTHRYIHGQRARYISPLALFLFTVFLMFFIFALLGEVKGTGRATTAQLRSDVAQGEAGVRVAEAASARAKAALAAADGVDAAERAGLRGAVAGAAAELEGERAELAAARERLATRETRIGRLENVRARLDEQEKKARAENDGDALGDIASARAILDRALANPTGPPDSVDANVNEKGEVSVNLKAGGEDGVRTLFEEIKAANAAGKVRINTGVESWNEAIRHKLDNPELAWYKLQNTAYKFSFLLVPISLPFIWLLFFWKRGVTLFDHTVFALYSLSFTSLLFIVLAIAARAPLAEAAAGAVATAMAVVIPAHMFFQIKGGYGLGWYSALWRTLLMLVFAMCALSIFLVVIFLLGLAG